MRSIRFLQGWGIYNAGETAGFPDKQAAELVEYGTAAYADGEEAPKGKAPKAPAADKMVTGKRSRKKG